MSNSDTETFGCIAIVALVFVAWFVSTAVFMWVWNFVMHGLFGLVEIGFWNSAGIMILLVFIKYGISFGRRERD
jgi:hypothetical protein